MELAPVDEQKRVTARQYIEDIKPEGYANLFEALVKGIRLFPDNAMVTRIPAVYLLIGGVATMYVHSGPKARVVEPLTRRV
jgi:hypothetical protein